MIAAFKPCKLAGTIDAPPSKSMTHRYLIGAALSGEVCELSPVDYSEDILASIDCLRALGANVFIDRDTVTIDPKGFMEADNPELNCRESGSTLRFFLPLALCLGRPVTLRGSRRLLERPLDVYEELCGKQGFLFQKKDESVTVCGKLTGGQYTLRGDISSQFITGLLFALVYLNQDASVQILPPMESRSYIQLTVSALRSFGADISFADDLTIHVGKSQLHGYSGKIEGDYSNAAFLDAFNYLGSDVKINRLKEDSLQGDRVYKNAFEQILSGTPMIDISDCPDLAPVFIALAAMKNGATFLGTDRLKLKESDRGLAMHEELKKLGGGLTFGDNTIIVPKQTLQYKGIILDGHNDHRIVMAMSVVLSCLGGCISGINAVRKSYPGFFDDIQCLGADVTLQ